MYLRIPLERVSSTLLLPIKPLDIGIAGHVGNYPGSRSNRSSSVSQISAGELCMFPSSMGLGDRSYFFEVD